MTVRKPRSRGIPRRNGLDNGSESLGMELNLIGGINR